MSKLSLAITKPTDVATVVDLGMGDYYKRLDSTSYSSKLVYGIVLDIVANDETVGIEVLEFDPSYGSVSTAHKVYSGEQDVQLFPARESDIVEILPGILSTASDKVGAARYALDVAIRAQDELKALAERIAPTDAE